MNKKTQIVAALSVFIITSNLLNYTIIDNRKINSLISVFIYLLILIIIYIFFYPVVHTDNEKDKKQFLFIGLLLFVVFLLMIL
ncbi:MAG: hypothetical protein CVU95_15960 [Firmicutes bacterium HGW-Firmicutes-2]|jgi:hypothetical protein|nr:MAG: hypothetical protein CVU95_15960 [Firmicutes bacterium HGW-Firmicutes-2]